MKIAQMDRQVIIQTSTSTLGRLGKEELTWTTFATVWSQRTSRPSREFYEAGRVVTDQQFYYTIRHLDGINVKMRLLDGSDTFEIEEVKYSDKRNSFIQLTCRKVK
jgi:SPP1 family predicted phage head-tail adaptor